MRGYLSFVLVLLSAILLLSAVSVLSEARLYDLSHAVALERAYGLEMNAKECALETIRQGAAAGFNAYDASHDLPSCSHCIDHFCSPPTPIDPLPPNICEEGLCSGCFRESEARAFAAEGASAALALLQTYGFDEDFSVSFKDSGPGSLEAFLVPDLSVKNGVRLDSVRFREGLPLSVQSDRLGVSLSARLPKGMVINYGPRDD